MRKILSLFVLSALATAAWGQSYSYRYWFDNDLTTAVSGSATGEKQFVIDINAIPAGLHALHVQAQNADGVWSSVHTRFFHNINLSSNAVTARYWIDNDLSTAHEITNLNEDFDTSVTHEGVLQPMTIVNIDASLLTLGYHTIHYQTFAADGTPSATRTCHLFVDKMHRALLTASISIDGGAATDYSLANDDIVIDIRDLEDGQHALSVSVSDYTGYFIGTKTGTFTVMNRIPGDVNGDGSVDIGDIVMVISVMTGSETRTDIVEAADVNNDGAADIGDIVAIIDIMTNQPAGARTASARSMAQPSTGDVLDATLTGSALNVSLTNAQEYAAFQFMLTLPEGTSLSEVQPNNDRARQHTVAAVPTGNGQYLVMGYSLSGQTIKGNGGELLTIVTNGQEPASIGISDVVLATPDSKTFCLRGFEAMQTALDGIATLRNDSQPVQCHDLSGRVLNGKPGKGLYIINGKKTIVGR